MAEAASYLYLGLAGETGRGRVVHSGLYRLEDGGGEWQALSGGLPEAPAVRALAVHPVRPEIVYAGAQDGVYRSGDRGEHWEKAALPGHGLPAWSILFHPHDPDVILAGCENCEIYRSDDGGERWTRLPVTVSIGIAVTGSDEDDTQESLLKRADEALYAAKRDGRNRTVTAAGAEMITAQQVAIAS